MSASTSHRSLLLAATGFGFLIISPSFAADPKTDPNLKDAAAALRNWRKAIVNVRLKYQWAWDHSKGKPTGGYDFIWTDSGQFRLYQWMKKDGTLDNDSLYASDGNRAYHVWRPQGDPPRTPKWVEIRPPGTGTNRLIEPLHGLWFPPRSKWIDELLDAGKAEYVGTDTVSGRNLPKIKLTRANGYPLWLTLDPRHGYLPVKVDSGSEGKRVRFLTEVTEFRRIGTPRIWFPSKGTFRSWVDGKVDMVKPWNVTEVTTNTDLPRSLFRPHIPDGTEVRDSFRGTVYYQGGRRSKGRREEKPGGERVSGAPRDSFWQRWSALILVAASGGFLVAAFVVHRRLSRRSAGN